MKKIILLRSNQIKSDSRVEKYLSFFKENNIQYRVFGWDRMGLNEKLENVTFFKRRVGYVVGGLKAAYNRLYWFKFIISSLKKEKPSFIHACDLDTAFPAAVYKFLYNRNCYLLFDAFDWVSADGAVKNHFIMKKFVHWMEYFSLKQSNKLLICEEERKVQVPNCDKYDYEVLPNIPMITSPDGIYVDKPEYKFNNDKFTFSYVGYFSSSRFLKELLRLAEEKEINLLIAGYGNMEIEDKCRYLNGSGNVKYFGKVEYKVSLNIMYNSDLIYAMYCKVVNNHYYAAPNKFYEPMALGRPVITTKGIIIGNKVEKMGFGYTIEEDYDELLELVRSLQKDDLLNKGKIARNLWDKIYCNYTHNFLSNCYVKWIK